MLSGRGQQPKSIEWIGGGESIVGYVFYLGIFWEMDFWRKFFVICFVWHGSSWPMSFVERSTPWKSVENPVLELVHVGHVIA